jgi:tetratricopeptide (TPR) repeat protein
LVYLLAHNDRAVDKDELQDAVWPGLVVTETALTRAVMKARKAVGDDASAQKVIKTIHGHGYRFVAECSRVVGGETANERFEPQESSAPTGQVQKRSYWLWIAGAVVIAAGFLGWKQFSYPQPEPGSIRLAVLPVQNQTGDTDLEWISLGLMSYASNLLGADPEMSLVPDGSVVSLVDSVDWDGSDEGDAYPDLLERLRRVYGTSHVLTMQLIEEGKLLRMNYQLQDQNDYLQRGTMVGEEATELARGVVQGVYGLMLRKSRLDADLPLISVDPFNNEAYARGMAHSLEGRCADAVPFFRMISEQEPTLFAPRYELAVCLRILGEPKETEDILLPLIKEQEALGSSSQLAKSLMLQGILYTRTGQIDQAESALGKALEVSREIDDPEISARVMQNLSIAAKSRSAWDEAREWLDLALLEYQRAGRETLPGQLYSAQANLNMQLGNLIEADQNLQQALKTFRDVGDRRNEAMMLNNTGYLRRLQGRLDEAEIFHLQSLAIREEIGDRVGVGRILGMLAHLYATQGQFDQAQATAEQAMSVAQETGDRLFEATSKAQLASIYSELGDRSAARANYLAARAIFEEIQDRMRVLQCDVRLARLDLEDGLVAPAEARAVEVLQLAREIDAIQPEIEAMELLGDVAAEKGELQQAAMEYDAALSRVRNSSWSGEEQSLLEKLAGVLMDQGDLKATAPLVGALSALEESSDSLKVQARYSHLNGDPVMALELMERARELAGLTWEESDQNTLDAYRDKK